MTQMLLSDKSKQLKTSDYLYKHRNITNACNYQNNIIYGIKSQITQIKLINKSKWLNTTDYLNKHNLVMFNLFLIIVINLLNNL